jgi:hypothetical protein
MATMAALRLCAVIVALVALLVLVAEASAIA